MTAHRRGRRLTSQRIGLAVLGAAVALATVAVPPLLVPGSRPDRETGAARSPGTSNAPPTTSPTVAATLTNVVTSRPPSSSPLSVYVEAEAPGNLWLGGAEVTECPTCRGGHRVRYLGASAQLVVRAVLPSSGHRVTLVYEADGSRHIKVSVNGVRVGTWQVSGTGWEQPATFQFAVDLPAGPVALTFYNDESPAPDIDAVLIS